MDNTNKLKQEIKSIKQGREHWRARAHSAEAALKASEGVVQITQEESSHKIMELLEYYKRINARQTEEIQRLKRNIVATDIIHRNKIAQVRKEVNQK